MAKKNKPSKLQQAASKKLAQLAGPKLSPFDMAHMMFHAEERGEVERVPLEDGTWAWLLPQQPDGQRPVLKPTPEMLMHLDRISQGDHGGAHG